METNSNFKEWFKNSKVVGKKKEPIKVFHGTIEEFDVFNTEPYDRSFSGLGATAIGSHFSESLEIAKFYPFGKEDDSNKKVIEVYLSIQNPKKYRTIQALQNELLQFYKDNDYLTLSPSKRLDVVKEFKRGLIEQGYDGITYLEGPPHAIKQNKERVWVAFYPQQIKSTSNKGLFSQTNPNINE